MPKKKVLDNSERFKDITDDDLAELRRELQNPNTLKSDKKCEKAFINYLIFRKDVDSLEYWLFDEKKLDNLLSKFWFAVKTQEGDDYRVSSLQHLRYAINRCLKRYGHEYDIIKSTCFKKSQKAFNDAVKHLKKIGKGYVVHYKDISPKDLVRLYDHTLMDPDADNRSLQRKVMFDIRYYMCRRGNENIHGMTKSTFKLHYDTETSITYVKKCEDELTKNHKEADNEVITGFMPQMLNASGQPHKLCPVRSFENYINHLNQNCEFLWQTPINKLKNYSKPEWYKAEPVGHNTHEKFMGRLSKDCGLSDHYTNHCIRVTGATNLTRANFSNKQVMSITGHKSLQSLAIYQKVQSDEKMLMGMSLTFCIVKPEEGKRLKEELRKKLEMEKENDDDLMAIEAPPMQVQQPENVVPEPHALDPTIPQAVSLDTALQLYVPTVAQNQPAPGPNQFDGNFDLMQLLSEFDNDDDNDLVLAATQYENTNTSTKMKQAVMKKNSPRLPLQPRQPVPSFANCTIGTLNIHIHKN